MGTDQAKWYFPLYVHNSSPLNHSFVVKELGRGDFPDHSVYEEFIGDDHSGSIS